jgi:hypothetical protein
MSFVDAIGIIGTVLGTISFAQDQIAGGGANGAVFRVKVGHQDTADQNYVSRLPDDGVIILLMLYREVELHELWDTIASMKLLVTLIVSQLTSSS